MSRYMLLFSVGPVQTFIEQARKTRDLWLGSFLLSKLMEAAMKDIDTKAQRFVFPVKREVEKDIPDLPNKYIAIFDNLEDAQWAARTSEEQLKDYWDTICNAVWDGIVNIVGYQEATQAIWKRQTNPETLFEIYWVIVKEGETAAYGDWLLETQHSLEARKYLRDFIVPYNPDHPEERNEPGEKSSVSGEREVLRGDGTSRQSLVEFWQMLSAHLSPKDISRDGSERLDAIDMVKRFVTDEHFTTRPRSIPDRPFPSTSSVATASFVQRLLTTQLDASTRTALRAWLEATKDLEKVSPDVFPYFAWQKRELDPLLREVLRRDGDCFFPETFTQYRLEKDYGFTDEKKAQRESIVKQGPQTLRTLFKATDALSIPRPTPYYAILHMDGDNMGDLLKEVGDQEEHQNISGALSEFAREVVPPLVQRERPGRLVYAGGDDLVTFAPLDGLLDLADLLQTKYCETIIPSVGKGHREDVSASMGITISHHFTALSYVLRTVREAEQLAKKRYGKNALVVTVLRRSGEQTRVGFRWRYPGLEEDGQPIKLFTRFHDLLEQDVLSPKAVYNLLLEAPTLIELNQNAQISEIKRILRRQWSDTKKKDYPDTEAEVLAKRLSLLADAMNRTHTSTGEKAVELHSDQLRHGLVETFGWLQVMAFLARKEED